MINLREAEAVDYVNRAYSTLHPEDDCFNLSLLCTLLRIESVHLEKLACEQSVLSVVTIDATGFPEFGSWMQDVQRVLTDFDNIKTERAKVLLPVMQQVINASPAGILRETEAASKTFARDFVIASAIHELSESQRNFLRHSESPEFSLYPSRDYPSCLVLSLGKTPFQSPRESLICGDRKSIYEGYLALKYIDVLPSSASVGEPTLLRARIMDKKISSLEASTPNQRFFDSKTGNPFPLPSASIARKLILTADFSTLNNKQIGSFFQIMQTIDQTVKDLSGFYKGLLTGRAISPAQLQTETAKLVDPIKNIFESIPDDQLRRMTQLALAEEMGEVIQDVQQAAILPNMALQTEQVLSVNSSCDGITPKKRRWPFRK